MQTAEQLNEQFALPGQLEFDEPYAGLPRAIVTTDACSARFYIYGAHLSQWHPCDRLPALFLSDHSAFASGTPIRGGIPVIFPWFGPPEASPVFQQSGSPETSPVRLTPGAPSHGFARTSGWTLRFATLVGEDMHLSLTLDHTDRMSQYGFSDFELVYEVILGRQLTVRLSVGNTGDQPILFEEALHTYLAVINAEDVTVSGLQNTEYLDKTDSFKRKRQTDELLRFQGEVDRPYLNTTAPVSLKDPGVDRKLTVSKSGSDSTVTWNPGAHLAARLPDLGDDAWRRFVCVETANVAENAITLAPCQIHTMEMNLTTEEPEQPRDYRPSASAT